MKKYLPSILERLDDARVEHSYYDVYRFVDWTIYAPFFIGNGLIGSCVDRLGMMDALEHFIGNTPCKYEVTEKMLETMA